MLTTPPSLIHKNAAILCLANLATSQCPPHACTDSGNGSGSSPLMFIKPTAVDWREKC